MGVRKTLASDAIEKEVVLAIACRAILIDTSAVSLCTTIEGTTYRTSSDEVIARIAGTSQWIGGALDEGPAERCTVTLTDPLWIGDIVESGIVEESRRTYTL
jgi:hypothetical protein